MNQVFEILVKWVETRDWEEALYSVMPKRKLEAKDGVKSAVKTEREGAEGRDGEMEKKPDSENEFVR